MMTTPGITAKRFCRCPLGTEGELSPGPDELNPHRSIDEKELVEDYKQREREHKRQGPYEPDAIMLPGLGAIDPLNDQGPRF